MSSQPPRIIDPKLSLMWLLSTAGSIIVAIALCALSISSSTEKTQAKLDALILNTAKLEKRVDDRDTRTDAIKEAQYSMLRTIDGQGMRIESLERAARK